MWELWSTVKIISYFPKVSLVEEETLRMTNSVMMQIEVCAILEIQSSYNSKAIDMVQGERSRLPERCAVYKLKLGRCICG